MMGFVDDWLLVNCWTVRCSVRELRDGGPVLWTCCAWVRVNDEANGLLEPVGIGLRASSDCCCWFDAHGLWVPG